MSRDCRPYASDHSYADPLPTPFPRSYWVIPNVFLAGFNPGRGGEDDVRRQVQGLLDAGIRCFVNLLEEDEPHRTPSFPYTRMLQDMAQQQEIGITYARFPIRDMGVPPFEMMRSILDLIDSAIRDNMPVYVHCWGGFGRTGTVVGCYLSRHGIAQGEGLIDHIKDLRANEARRDMPSPQTELQRMMIRAWRHGR